MHAWEDVTPLRGASARGHPRRGDPSCSSRPAISARAWTRSRRSLAVSKQTVYKHFARQGPSVRRKIVVNTVNEEIADPKLRRGDETSRTRAMSRRTCAASPRRQLARVHGPAAAPAAPAGDRLKLDAFRELGRLFLRGAGPGPDDRCASGANVRATGRERGVPRVGRPGVGGPAPFQLGS